MPAKKKTKPKAIKKKSSATDRNRVAGGQKYEVAYVAKKMGVTAAAVKAAIKKVGNMRKDIETELKKKKSSASDRNRVAGGQKYEVAYVAKKMSVTSAAVKAAIKKVGNMRKAVEAALKNK